MIWKIEHFLFSLADFMMISGFVTYNVHVEIIHVSLEALFEVLLVNYSQDLPGSFLENHFSSAF